MDCEAFPLQNQRVLSRVTSHNNRLELATSVCMHLSGGEGNNSPMDRCAIYRHPLTLSGRCHARHKHPWRLLCLHAGREYMSQPRPNLSLNRKGINISHCLLQS